MRQRSSWKMERSEVFCSLGESRDCKWEKAFLSRSVLLTCGITSFVGRWGTSKHLTAKFVMTAPKNNRNCIRGVNKQRVHANIRHQIFPSYNQQEATFLDFLLLQMLYMFQAVPPPIIRSTQLYIQLQVLSTSTAASCQRGWDGTAAR